MLGLCQRKRQTANKRTACSVVAPVLWTVNRGFCGQRTESGIVASCEMPLAISVTERWFNEEHNRVGAALTGFVVLPTLWAEGMADYIEAYRDPANLYAKEFNVSVERLQAESVDLEFVPGIGSGTAEYLDPIEMGELTYRLYPNEIFQRPKP